MLKKQNKMPPEQKPFGFRKLGLILLEEFYNFVMGKNKIRGLFRNFDASKTSVLMGSIAPC